MHIEYEATYPNVNKEQMRELLRSVGAVLVRPEFLQKRYNFYLPGDQKNDNSWLRVRDEDDKITMSYKSVEGKSIGDQKEICLTIDSYDQAIYFLEKLGCKGKAYQETTRELWMLDGVEITIDGWPFLEPFVEIEGKSEQEVRDMSKKLGFDFSDAVFGGADELYNKKYGIDKEIINTTPKLRFEDENPFIKYV
jgi:adenylate cyclase class 2